MAEEDSSQEKTEEATPKRLQKAKEDGQAPRSKELTTTTVILSGALALLFFGELLAEKMLAVMRFNFSIKREVLFDNNFMIAYLAESFYQSLLGLIPFFVILFVAAIAGPLALGGWIFSGKSLLPKASRIDPLAGLKRMFSAKSLMELFKAIGKVAIVIAVSYILLLSMKDSLMGLSSEGLQRGIAHSLQLSILATIILSASTILIALIDIPFQIHDYTQKLKMSRQEVKDELKDSEGKPEVKGKIRQLQQQIAQRQMMSAVPEADVIITNPTHFSVALKYDPKTMDTPLLLAKGVDHMALKIREVGKANGVEFVEAPALARAVYHTTKLEEAIPEGLYVAVAQVLAYIFQLREYRRGNTEKPMYPRSLKIPKEMQY